MQTTNRRHFLRASAVTAISGLIDQRVATGQAIADDDRAGITFLGASGRVSGSMFLVSFPPDRVLIDCGTFYDEGDDSNELNAEITEEAISASVVLLTHAHVDHVGRLPLLIERGFKGTIAATEPTLTLLHTMLKMGTRYSDRPDRDWLWTSYAKRTQGRIPSAVLHWRPECQWERKILSQNRQTARGSWSSIADHLRRHYKANSSPCKVCAELEVEPIMKRCKSFKIDKPFRVGQHTEVTATEAGHLPGSVSYHLSSRSRSGATHRILLSGDIGPSEPILQRGAGRPPPADVVVVECTYGASPPTTTQAEELARFREVLISHLKQDHAVWIPCFALDRTEKVLMQIQLALQGEAGRALTRSPKVFVQSPSANEFHALYQLGGTSWGLRSKYMELGGRSKKGATTGFQPEVPSEVHALIDAAQAREMGLSGFPDPADLADAAMASLRGNILLTTSGMMSEAFSEQLFRPLAKAPTTTIFLVGYQDPKSTGGKLRAADREGRRFLDIGGEQVEVHAIMENFSGFSGHGNVVEIDQWLNSHDRGMQIFLVHGEAEKLATRQADLLRKGWKKVDVPNHRQHFQL